MMMVPRHEAQPALFCEFSLEVHIVTDHLLRSVQGPSHPPRRYRVRIPRRVIDRACGKKGSQAYDPTWCRFCSVKFAALP